MKDKLPLYGSMDRISEFVDIEATASQAWNFALSLLCRVAKRHVPPKWAVSELSGWLNKIIDARMTTEGSAEP